MDKLRDFYKGKRVLVTGHTGFKGSWLSIWLLELGAEVIGYSKGIPTDPSNFKACNLEKKLKHIKGNIKNLKMLKQVFSHYSPEIVFHLAAQPIVRDSYLTPRETFFTNIGGTVNILECLRKYDCVKSAVIITSDKCYKNMEWHRGYHEKDMLGGEDPYSASKAAAEIVFYSYYKSFFSSREGACKIASARAGNVIGGGDWAKDRIIPDCVRAFSHKKIASIRNPKATRPWQHVLESASGYLWLASQLMKNPGNTDGQSFNFGPNQKVTKSVKDLIETFKKYFKQVEWDTQRNEGDVKEHLSLKLSCGKARSRLKWHSVLSFEKTVKMTADWYRHFYDKDEDMFEVTTRQIRQYVADAKKERLEWAGG